MAKKPKCGKCIHCLGDPVERDWDHVFPKSWYPDTTPVNLYKWQVPSCIPCNKSLGVLERDLLVRLAFCVDRENPASSGLYDKALRAVDPEAARNMGDQKARQKLNEYYASEMQRADTIPQSAIYPGLHERWGRGGKDALVLPISPESLRKLTEKIVRGITYVADNSFIEPPRCIEFIPDSASNAETVSEVMKNAEVYERGPGIVVHRVQAGAVSLFAIELFKQLRLFASVRSTVNLGA